MCQHEILDCVLCTFGRVTSEERMDSNTARRRRKAKQLGQKLTRRYLKDDVVPSIFPHAPEYLSTTGNAPKKTVSATASSRLEHEARRLDALEQSFNAADDNSSNTLDEIADKLLHETALSQGFTVTKFDSELLIYCLKFLTVFRPSQHA